MRAYIFILLISSSLQFIHTRSTSALDIRDKNTYLYDIRGDDGDIYVNHLSIGKATPRVNTSVFSETQWNLDTDEWEKLLFGIEINTQLWRRLYVGQSIQLISGQLLDHINLNTHNISADTTTKICLKFPLFRQFSCYLSEEYSLNLEEGLPEYCETSIWFSYSTECLYSIAIGWHHTDRIHHFDSDYMNISFSLNF